MKEILEKLEKIIVDIRGIQKYIKFKNLLVIIVMTVLIGLNIFSIFYSKNINLGISSSLMNCEMGYLRCEDFYAQEEAQFFLNYCEFDKNNLDPDKNGVACEDLPKLSEKVKIYP